MEDRYEIRDTLGRGGLGAVYRAFDRHLKREVALKRINPDGTAEDRESAISQITREAATLSSLQHPHIVTVFDVGVDQGGPFVVMELLTGKSLEDLIERNPLTWQDFRELAQQTQEALIAAHDLSLLHLDLKPGNIVLTWLPSGRFQAKLVDFGLAKFAPQPTLQDIEKGDSVFGSIFFMAPEQFERLHLDARTDLYAMGCVYYHALTGGYPFSGNTGQEVMQAHLEHRVIPLYQLRPDIPRWAADWVMWHINRLPEQRPSDAREALKFFLSNDDPPITQSVTPRPEPVAQAVPRSHPMPHGPVRPGVAAAGQQRQQGRPQVPMMPGARPGMPQGVIPTAQPVIPVAVAVEPTPPGPGSPQPLTPPEGSRPSVQTQAQELVAQVQAAAQAPPVAAVPVVPLTRASTPPAAAAPPVGRAPARPAAPAAPAVGAAPARPAVAGGGRPPVAAVAPSGPLAPSTAPVLGTSRAPTGPRVPGAPIPGVLPPAAPPRKKRLTKGQEFAIAAGFALVIVVVLAMIIGAMNG